MSPITAKSAKLLITGLLAMSLLPAAFHAQPASAASGKIVLGYYNYYYTGDKGSYNSLNNYSSYMTDVAMTAFDTNAYGKVVGTVPTDGLNLAASRYVGAYATISDHDANGNFSGTLAHTVLSDPAIRQTLETNAINLAKTYKFKGINLDFENMLPADRPLFNQFLQEFAPQLHQNNLKLTVSVAAKTSDQPNVSWVGAFDYATIGKSADYIQLMTYDEYGPWDVPGPVAGFDWVTQVLNYALPLVPSTQLILGLPAYGYDWNLTNSSGSKAVTWKNTPSLITNTGAVPQWDAASQSPYFSYKASDGSSHTVWYENTASIAAKTKLVSTYNLAGVSMWSMRCENDTFWKTIQSNLQ